MTTFWATFEENLATFYCNIWSHCDNVVVVLKFSHDGAFSPVANIINLSAIVIFSSKVILKAIFYSISILTLESLLRYAHRDFIRLIAGFDYSLVLA